MDSLRICFLAIVGQHPSIIRRELAHQPPPCSSVYFKPASGCK